MYSFPRRCEVEKSDVELCWLSRMADGGIAGVADRSNLSEDRRTFSSYDAMRLIT